MPKSVEKTRKKISKKKGNITALHENSRDAQSMRRALMRDDKLLRMAAEKRKVNHPLVLRALFFQRAIRDNGGLPLELATIHEHIQENITLHLLEYETLKSERRPGRPPSAREDALKTKLTTDAKEYETGFYLPDLTEANNVMFLDRWDGAWSYLSTLKWVRLSIDGYIQETKFPPTGKA